MSNYEFKSSGYSGNILIYSTYDSGYDYTICLYHNATQYIARKGELYINGELALGDETTLDKFLLEYASYFNYVIICEDGGAEMYESFNPAVATFKINGITDIKLGKFA